MESEKNKDKMYSRKTITVDELASVLGIGRSAAYNLVRVAEENNGHPFKVVRIGGSVRISAKSFKDYLDDLGL